MADDDFNLLKNMQINFGQDEDSQGKNQRLSFRVKPLGVKVKTDKIADTFWVSDLSIGGVCMVVPDGLFLKDEKFIATLLIAEKEYLTNLETIVVRSFAHECACLFLNISKRQELKLDKLVLAMQKHLIAQQKRGREDQRTPDQDPPDQ